jgi:hypothetical protein
VTGEQQCKWTDFGEDKKSHLLWCTTAESKLFLGGAENPALFLEDLTVTIPGLSDSWDISQE